MTVRARDPFNTYVNMTVNISVTDMDEDGTVSLSTSQPRVATAITATLNDPDSGQLITSWQWEWSNSATGPRQVINGATSRSYTPVAGDLNKLLRATATYSDAFGTGKTVQSGFLHVGAARAPRTSGGGNDNHGNNGSGDPNQPPDTGPNTIVTQSVSVTYGSANYRVNEEGAAQVTVRLSTGAPRALNVPVTVSRGTAESRDYRVSGLSGGALNFSQGSRSRSFTITALQYDDADDETLNLAFGTLAGGISAGSNSTATFTVRDDDVPALTVSVAYGFANYRVNEGGAAQVPVRLSTAVTSALQVPVTVSRGTAESGDYRVSGLSGGALNFSQGSRSRSFTITALQDDDTDDETLKLAFGTLPGSVSLGSISRGMLTILGDDAATLTVSYGSSNYRVNEGGAAQVTVRLSTAATNALQVPVTVSRGTAESGDYRVSGLSKSTLRFSQGSRSASFTITTLQDNYIDDETLTFGTLPGGVLLGSIPQATLTIMEDDAAPLTVSYGSANYRINEGGAAQVTVRLSTGAPRALNVPVTVSGGTAESGDYRESGLSNGALRFSQGSRSASFTITALQDADADDETLFLGFGTLPGSVSLGSIPRSTIAINDDEVPPPLQLSVYYRSTRYAVTEGMSISVTVRLSADSDRTLQIPISATTLSAGEESYVLSGLTEGTLYLDAGERSRSFAFTALQDDDAEDKQVRLGFGQLPNNVVAGSRSAGTVTIEDDDLSPVLVESVNGPPVFTEGEITSRTVTEQAPRATPVGLPVTAVDPDGDPLTYYLSGIDAFLFSLNSRTSQLQVMGQLDLEVKATHLLNVSVSDGRGGADSIVVAVNLSDIQEVNVASPTDWVVGLATGEGPLHLETPDGTAPIEFPADMSNLPVFVRVESAAVDCGGQWPPGAAQALITIQLYDSLGNIMRDADMEGAVASLRFDALAICGVEAAYAALEDSGIQVYGYREQEGKWRLHDFTLDVDELGIVA